MVRRRSGIVTALALLAASAACAGASAGSAPAPDLMVVGDSISAHWRYDATGDGGRTKAWWAYVADAAGLDLTRPGAITINAVPGTGMMATGPAGKHAVTHLDGLSEACGDNSPGQPDRSFGSRLNDISLTRPPRVLIVEGGRNDFKKCVDGTTRLSTVAESKESIDTFMELLAVRVEAAGIARSDVFVVTPWGPNYPAERSDITPLVEAATRFHGFNWISTPPLPQSDTFDGTHPNGAGTRWLADQIEKNSDIVERLDGEWSRHRARRRMMGGSSRSRSVV